MPQPLANLSKLLNGKLNGDGAVEIVGVAALDAARAGEISFVEKTDFIEQAKNTRASALIVPENFAAAELPCASIAVKNPKLAFAKAAAKLHALDRKTGVHKEAQIAETAKLAEEIYVGAFASIGENSSVGKLTQIGEGARVGANVTIGENCIVYPNVVIYDNVSIGNNVILNSGAIIGADGFGFVRDADRYVKFPQIGTVIIEDDAEIGANTCIDRGALGETRIGKGTKIDNLVQIAHNVQIGERVIIAAQTGISGSTVVEDDCIIGGQVGMGDHARVLSGAIIGSQAGILPGKIVRAGVWWGTPVQPLEEYKRQNAHLKGLARLTEEIKELKRKLSEK